MTTIETQYKVAETVALDQKTLTETVIVNAAKEDVSLSKDIMRHRQAAKAHEKIAKTLEVQLKSKHECEGKHLILKTARRVISWFTWVKQTAKWQDEQIIPAGWKLGKASHSRFFPRDPSGKVSNKEISKTITEIENTIESI